MRKENILWIVCISALLNDSERFVSDYSYLCIILSMYHYHAVHYFCQHHTLWKSVILEFLLITVSIFRCCFSEIMPKIYRHRTR